MQVVIHAIYHILLHLKKTSDEKREGAKGFLGKNQLIE
jgi:hypothetical protein